MRRATKAVVTSGACLGLMLGGAGVAQADLAWGTLTVTHDGKTQGQGYGTAYGYANTAVLQSTLRDLRKGGGRTYAEATGYGKNPQFVMQSGRRTDGGSTYAEMATQYHTTQVPASGYYAEVKVCQDIPRGFDPCSSAAYGSF